VIIARASTKKVNHGKYLNIRAMVLERGIERAMKLNVSTDRCFLSVTNEKGETFAIQGRIKVNTYGLDFIPFKDADKYWLKHEWKPDLEK
jgi:hypothetical protein